MRSHWWAHLHEYLFIIVSPRLNQGYQIPNNKDSCERGNHWRFNNFLVLHAKITNFGYWAAYGDDHTFLRLALGWGDLCTVGSLHTVKKFYE